MAESTDTRPFIITNVQRLWVAGASIWETFSELTSPHPPLQATAYCCENGGEQGTEKQIQKDRQKHSAPPKQLCDRAEEPEKANHKASEKS